MLWNAANLQWNAAAMQWDATFLVENTAVADACSIIATTAGLNLPGLVLCGDTLNVSMIGALSSSEGVSAYDTVGVTAAVALSSAENASLLAAKSAASSLLVSVGETVGSADSTGVVVVANPGISEALTMSVSDTVSAKMLTGLSFWNATDSLWDEAATQWDATPHAEMLAAADICGITATSTWLQLPNLVTCSDSLGTTSTFGQSVSEAVEAAAVSDVTASALPSLIEETSAISGEGTSTVVDANITDLTTLADILSHILVVGPSVSETVAAAVVESVAAKMLTGLNTWNDAYSLWGDRTHAWDIYLSSMTESVVPYDAIGDLSETIDYLLESVQFGDGVVISCGVVNTLAEPLGVDLNTLANVDVVQTLLEVCATSGEFFDKSPRRKYEYDQRTDGIWRYDDGWYNDWNRPC